MRQPLINILFRLTLGLACGLSAFYSQSQSQAQAQAYPLRPIRLVIPFPPGGSTDTYARILGPKLSERLGQAIIIDNRPGAGGAVGAEIAAKAGADGYTLVIGQTANMVIGPILRQNNLYDPERHFAPISLIMKSPQVMVVAAQSPIRTAKELIAAAKSAPGTLTYGSAGIGSTGHISGELLNQAAQVQFLHIPYKGGAAAVMDLMGGRITYLSTSLASAGQYVAEKKLRAIVTTGLQRARPMPDVPTLSEAALPGFELVSWHGFLAPASVPRSVVLRLNRELVAALATPEVQKMLYAEGGEISPSTPEAFQQFLHQELSKWGQIIRSAGIRPE